MLHPHSPSSSSVQVAKSPPRLPERDLSCSSLREDEDLAIFDARLSLKEKNGARCVLELNSEVLAANNSVFADLVADYRRNSKGLCRLEVLNVDNLGVFRTIDMLEVSACLKFTRGVHSCLEYIEAMPWTEEEEGKLRSLFSKLKFEDETARDIVARLYVQGTPGCEQKLTRSLVLLVTSCGDVNARNELKPLVKGIVCRSSVHEKERLQLNREDIAQKLEERISSMATELALWLSQSEKDGREMVLIFHTFSNTGWPAYGPILDNCSNREDVLDKIKGCVVDSGGDPHIDPKCGFKMFTRAATRKRFPNIRLKRWCFDVEIVYICKRLGVPIVEVSVNWTEIPGSKVNLMSIPNMLWELAIMSLGYRSGHWKIKN